MTLEETKKLLMMIDAAYPNFKVDNPQETAATWQWMLAEYPADAILGSLQIYVKTNKSGFAPSVSQLIDGMHKPKDQERMTEGEAWYIVRKAIADSGYSAKEHFDEFPPEIKRAVGSPEMLRKWGMMDSEEVNTVIMSNFQRTYRAVISQQEYAERVPAAVSDLVKGLTEKVNPNRIEKKEIIHET